MTKTKITAEPGKQEIIIEREFDALRELVFKAFTDPKLTYNGLGLVRSQRRLRRLSQEMEVHGAISRKTQTVMSTHFMA